MFSGEPSAEDHESGNDASEADEDVNEGEDGQAHGVVILVCVPDPKYQRLGIEQTDRVKTLQGLHFENSFHVLLKCFQAH